MNKATATLAILLASVLSFFAGGYVGHIVSPKTTIEPNGEYSSIAQLSKTLKPGESATISVDEARTGPILRKQGAVIKSEKAYTSFLDPIGQQAVEAGTKSQGIEGVKKGGEEVEQAGENKGSGILENLWATARGWLVVGLVILAVVFIILPIIAAVVPALAPAIGGIVSTFGTVLASAIPFLGSIILWIKKNLLHTQATQIVTGIEQFKTEINATKFVEDPTQNAAIVKTIMEIFAKNCNSAQDSSTKSLVNNLQVAEKLKA